MFGEPTRCARVQIGLFARQRVGSRAATRRAPVNASAASRCLRRRRRSVSRARAGPGAQARRMRGLAHDTSSGCRLSTIAMRARKPRPRGQVSTSMSDKKSCSSPARAVIALKRQCGVSGWRNRSQCKLQSERPTLGQLVQLRCRSVSIRVPNLARTSPCVSSSRNRSSVAPTTIH